MSIKSPSGGTKVNKRSFINLETLTDLWNPLNPSVNNFGLRNAKITKGFPRDLMNKST